MNPHDFRRPLRVTGIALAAMSLAAAAVACGSGSSAKTVSTATPAVTADAGGGRNGGGGGRNRPEIRTSIAQGTPLPFGRNRTPSPDEQTAIAQRTPAASFRPPGGGGDRIVMALAPILGVDETMLRTELQADGASVEKVAAAHGVDRPTLRTKLIDASRARRAASATTGTITQQQADDAEAQFERNLDTQIDRVGGGFGGGGGADSSGPGGAANPPPAPAQ